MRNTLIVIVLVVGTVCGGGLLRSADAPPGDTAPAAAPEPPTRADVKAWPALPPPTIACRGCEECGRYVEDNPGWGSHMPTLFIARKNPDISWQTPQQHIDWARNPLHSYVADGTGGLTIIAHPGAGQDEPMATLKGLDGMEICHGGDFSKEARGRWDRALTARLKKGLGPLWGFAADDTHGWQKGNRSWLAVRLEKLGERELKAALRSGNFYVSTGPVIADIQVRGGTVSLTLGQPSDVQWLRSGQYGLPTKYGIASAVVSREGGEGRCLKLDKQVTTSTYTLNDADGTTKPEDALFIRCIVTAGERAAMTQPFVLRSATTMDNPYAAAGTWFKGMTHNHTDALAGQDDKAAEYHAGYAGLGHAFAFETGYDYWVMPFQHYPADRTPVIDRAEPMRLPPGQGDKVHVLGSGFAHGVKVLINGRELEGSGIINAGKLELEIPSTLPPGRHDITVRNPDGFQDTLQYALVVQSATDASVGWTQFTPANSKLGAGECYRLCPDAKGGMWVATNYGLNHFDGEQWRLFRRADSRTGLMADTIYGLALEPDGSLWYTSFRGVGRRAADGTWQQWPVETGLPNKQVNQVLRVGNSVYVSVFNRPGLYVLAGEKWQQVPGSGGDSAKGPAIHGLAADAQGRIWMGSAGGLFSWEPAKGKDGWKRYTTKDGLPDDYVTRLAFDAKGRLWVGTATKAEEQAGGLACLDSGKWTSYTPGNSSLPERRVWSVFVDRAGCVWAATSKGAACLKPDGQWRVLTAVDSGLADNMVTDIAQDAQGNLWFATANGVSRLEAKQAGAGQ